MEDYTSTGFDKFLSRGDDPNLGGSLDQQTMSNNAVPFDRTQSTGALGDTFRIGNILLDGSAGRITISDDSGNTVVIIGDLGD